MLRPVVALALFVLPATGPSSWSAEPRGPDRTPTATFPSYAEARLLIEKHWKERFPVPYLALRDVPPGHRILFARTQNVPVYYYRFEVDLPRLFRDEAGQAQTEEDPARRAEVWFRYQPQLHSADFAFVREDLLPGTDRRWIE